jgi:hypothetical protein
LPAFPEDDVHPQYEWFRDGFERGRTTRHEMVDQPDSADAILLTDIGAAASHARFGRRSSRLLLHPLVRRYRQRCFVYHEQDVPRPYLPGLYAYMEWFPGVEDHAAAVAPAENLEMAPNRYIDDSPPPEARDLLFAFMGRNCHPARDRLLGVGRGRGDIVVLDTARRYDHYSADPEASGQQAFVQALRRSRWAICPRGWSTASRRLFEAMRLGIAPVVVSDGWLPPRGPDWEACVLWIPGSDVSDLVSILERREGDWRAIGRAARAAYEEYFSPGAVFDHALAELERLASRWRATSMSGAARRQWVELACHAIGFTSPAIARARRRCRTWGSGVR